MRILRISRTFPVVLSAWLGACAVPEPTVGERAGEPATCSPNPVDPRRSLFVTDLAVLRSSTDFSLRRVLGQIAEQTGDPALDAETLFRQLWDTTNASSNNTFEPACDSAFTQAAVNGFPYTCNRAEGLQASTPAALDLYRPIALVNRFDLAPPDGANCGEYRMVFAKDPQGPKRSFLIFEAGMPNPQPGCGLRACYSLVKAWARLGSIASPTQRAIELERVYFQGLPGFEPVVHKDHFAAGRGQVRANMFLGEPDWLLREWNFGANRFEPAAVKVTPYQELMNGALATSSPFHAQATAFQGYFPGEIESLAVNDIHRFGYQVPLEFDAGQSNMTLAPIFGLSVNFANDAGASSFRTAIDSRLTSLGSPLTAEQVVRRADVLSCGGCHHFANTAPSNDLGGGLVWPPSLGFVHSSETQTEAGPNGERFVISPALSETFLPRRKLAMDAFMQDAICAPGCAPPPPGVTLYFSERPGAVH